MTVRTLVLLRHAKAETPGERPDHERRLTTTGEADAGAAGAWLAGEGIHPQLVICSTATRTRQTWQGVSVALGGADPEVHYEDRLYEGGRTEVFDLLRAVPDDVGTVLVVGHNPTVSDVSVLLRNSLGDAMPAGLKTSGLAVHRTEHPWSQTEPGSAGLVREHTARA